MSYKTFLYKLVSILSPNFYKEISGLITSTKENLTIFDIGFYNGEFTKQLIENLDIDSNKQSVYVYSFDPNDKINRKDFKEFVKLNNIHWKHFSNAIGDKNSREKFYHLVYLEQQIHKFHINSWFSLHFFFQFSLN